MKKVLSVLLALTLLCGLACPAAAETASAATLRLEKAEGTVGLKNGSGRDVTLTEGMRLYSGYALNTEKSSYAYVSLDSDKAVKLDASSRVEVARSGRKLELKVTAGNLFFNVSVPVDSDETLNIRTSTMVTGIRGTAGWVEVVDRTLSRLHLLEGEVEITSADPRTGEIQQVTIVGGQTATAVLYDESQSNRREIIVTTFEEEDVPGSVALEVAEDPHLQARITENTDLSVEEIIANAQERQDEAEAEAEERDQAIQEALTAIQIEEVTPVFAKVEEEDDGGDEGEEAVAPAPAPTPTPTPAPDPYDLDDPTTAEVQRALDEGLTTLAITNANLTQTWDIAATGVPAGITMDVQSGTVNVGGGTTAEVAGTLIVAETMTNGGTVNITSTNSLRVSGALTNNGTINVGVGAAPGRLAVESGTLNNNGTINITSGSTLENSGALSNNGGINVTGGALSNTGTMTNGNTITVSGGSVTNSGTLDNDGGINLTGGALSNAGTLNNNESGTVTNSTAGTFFTNTGSFENWGTLGDSGIFENRGTFTNYTGSSIADMVYIHNYGTYVVPEGQEGTLPENVRNQAGSTLHNKGNISVTADGGASIELPVGVNVINTGTITVEENAALNITCASLTSDGDITVAANGTINVGSEDAASKLVIAAGKTLDSSGTINIAAGSTLEHGGTFTSSGALNNRGSIAATSGSDYAVRVTGGTFTNESTGSITSTGGGVRVMVGGTAEIKGGTITASGDDTYAIFNGAEVIMSGGTASGTGRTGVRNAGTFVMSGDDTRITGGEDGVLNSGTFTMTGGSVTGTDGDGIVNAGGAIELSGGAVTGSSAQDGIRDGSSGNGAITIKGTARVYGGGNGIEAFFSPISVSESAVVEGGRCGIYIPSSTYAEELTVSGGTITGRDCGIKKSGSGTITMTSGTVTGTGTGVSTSTGIEIARQVSINLSGGTVSGLTCGIYNSGTLTMTGGTVTSTGGDGIENSGTIELSGGSVTGAASGCGINDNSTGIAGAITVTGDAEVTGADGISASFKSVTVSGNAKVSGTNGRGIYMGASSGQLTLTISDDAAISGIGFGVYSSGTAVTMTGGTVTGNYGIRLMDSSTITMTSGTVTGGSGGGIDVGSATEETSGAKAEISGGTVSGNFGIRNYGTLEISGTANITCTSVSGVVNWGTAEMIGGTVIGQYKGVTNYGTFTITNGQIRHELIGSDSAGEYAAIYNNYEIINNVNVGGPGTLTVGGTASIQGHTGVSVIAGSAGIQGGTIEAITLGTTAPYYAVYSGATASVTFTSGTLTADGDRFYNGTRPNGTQSGNTFTIGS